MVIDRSNPERARMVQWGFLALGIGSVVGYLFFQLAIAPVLIGLSALGSIAARRAISAGPILRLDEQELRIERWYGEWSYPFHEIRAIELQDAHTLRIVSETLEPRVITGFGDLTEFAHRIAQAVPSATLQLPTVAEP